MVKCADELLRPLKPGLNKDLWQLCWPCWLPPLASFVRSKPMPFLQRLTLTTCMLAQSDMSK